MQKPLLTVAVFATTLLVGAVRAQDPASAVGVATPSSPAPAVATPATPNQIIYVPRLPTPTELANAAAATPGVAVDRIEQASAQIAITYRYSNGQTNTVAYQLLPTATAVAVAPAPSVVYAAPAPTVVCAPPPRVVYYEPVYQPRYYYPPISFGFGFGYRHFHHHHHGFHHGR